MTSEDIQNSLSNQDDTYTETVVEYVDNRRSRVVLSAILVVLFFLLIAVSWFVYSLAAPVNPPSAADLPDGVTWVRSIYAWGSTAGETLEGPIDTAVAPDGTIWTTTNGTMLVGFDPQGQTQHVISREHGTEPGQFMSLQGLDVDEDGNIWVCDVGRNAVVVLTPEGEELNEIGVQLPQEIDVKGDRVAIAAAAGVAILDTEGNLIAQWGQRGPGEGDFDLPHGIAIGDDGIIYVSDTQNRRIKAYTEDGRMLWLNESPVVITETRSTSTTETADGVLQRMQVPVGMTFDGAGRLVMVDAFEFQMLVIDTELEGQIVARYGEDGPEDGKFAYPTGISYDPARDTFAVADTANNRLQLIRIPGSGGNAAARAIATVTDQPFWLCFLPLLLLVIAAVVMLRRRRSARTETEQSA